MPNNNTEIVLDDKDDGNSSPETNHRTSIRFKYKSINRNLTH
jgi:hypothetical protein